MAATTTNNGDGSFTLTNAGHSVVVSLRDDQVSGGWVALDVKAEDGVHSTPIVIHLTDSGGRVAADHPTCNPAYAIVDGDGKITNG